MATGGVLACPAGCGHSGLDVCSRALSVVLVQRRLGVVGLSGPFGDWGGTRSERCHRPAVDATLGQFREFAVGGPLFLERLLQEVSGTCHAE